ncbi:MAG: VWA domain-containing protein [Gemmatimonadota bacterium]
MSFLWPRLLWSLLLVPVLIALYLFILRRRRKAAVRYSGLGLVREAMGNGPGLRRHVPPLLLLLGLTVLLLAMARPAALVTLPSERDTVILAMDVSGSMRAGDVDPNRIIASQQAAKQFVEAQPRSTRLGVVAFAGTAMLVQLPTHDREAVTGAIDRFRLQRGTNVGGAILVSLEALFPGVEFDLGSRFSGGSRGGAPLGEAGQAQESSSPVEPGSHPHAAVVLLTDGQATTGPDPVDAARLAADRGVRIFTVGFGSREGETVGFGGWSMRVHLDEETLRRVSEITLGRYFHASSSDDLAGIYDELTTQFVLETTETEVTAFFAGFAALLVVLSATLSLVWFNRIG